TATRSTGESGSEHSSSRSMMSSGGRFWATYQPLSSNTFAALLSPAPDMPVMRTGGVVNRCGLCAEDVKIMTAILTRFACPATGDPPAARPPLRGPVQQVPARVTAGGTRSGAGLGCPIVRMQRPVDRLRQLRAEAPDRRDLLGGGRL